MDLTGRTVAFKDGLNGSSCTIMRKGISPGMYIANVYTEKGFASIRIIFN